LAKEFINATMVPFLLPSVFHIIERSTQEEFTANILSSLKPVMKMMEPVQILLIFMQVSSNITLYLHFA
jgi:SCY1-like protein 2